MIKTVLVDDHKLFCDGLEKVLTETHKFEIIGKFSSGKSVLNAAIDPLTSLLILDIEMPELNGFDIINRLRLKDFQLKIVVLSMHEEMIYSNEAQAIGADGYLTKTLESSELVELLVRITQGEKIFLKKTQHKKNDSLLSDREIEVLRLLAKGKTSKQIGAELKISPLTIKAHRRNMIKKLKVNNSTELITKVLEEGIL